MVWTVIRTVTAVPGSVIAAVTAVVGSVVGTATGVSVEAVMLLADVSRGIVTAVARLSDAGNGDCARGRESQESLRVSRVHVATFLWGSGASKCSALTGRRFNWTFVGRQVMTRQAAGNRRRRQS